MTSNGQTPLKLVSVHRVPEGGEKPHGKFPPVWEGVDGQFAGGGGGEGVLRVLRG